MTYDSTRARGRVMHLINPDAAEWERFLSDIALLDEMASRSRKGSPVMAKHYATRFRESKAGLVSEQMLEIARQCVMKPSAPMFMDGADRPEPCGLEDAKSFFDAEQYFDGCPMLDVRKLSVEFSRLAAPVGIYPATETIRDAFWVLWLAGKCIPGGDLLSRIREAAQW